MSETWLWVEKDGRRPFLVLWQDGKRTQADGVRVTGTVDFGGTPPEQPGKTGARVVEGEVVVTAPYVYREE